MKPFTAQHFSPAEVYIRDTESLSIAVSCQEERIYTRPRPKTFTNEPFGWFIDTAAADSAEVQA